MAKTNDTLRLERMIRNYTKNIGSVFSCDEVTIGIGGKERVDFMSIDTKKIVRCYEIKVSKSDFYSKAAVTFIGHYNYYVMPMDLYCIVKDDIGIGVGVLCDGWCVRKPKKQKMKSDYETILISMVRSLYRDAEKIRDSEDVVKMKDLLNSHDRLRKDVEYHKQIYNKINSAMYEVLTKDERRKIRVAMKE